MLNSKIFNSDVIYFDNVKQFYNCNGTHDNVISVTSFLNRGLGKNSINKFCKEKAKYFKFGNDLSADWNKLKPHVRASLSNVFHSWLSKVPFLINRDSEKRKVSGVNLLKCYIDDNYKYLSSDNSMLNMMLNNLLYFLNHNDICFLGASYPLTEHGFFTKFDWQHYINFFPDYINELSVVDYKNYSNHLYDFKQLVFYGTMLQFRDCYYINFVKGEIVKLDLDVVEEAGELLFKEIVHRDKLHCSSQQLLNHFRQNLIF